MGLGIALSLVFMFVACYLSLIFGPIIILLKRISDDAGGKKLGWLYAAFFGLGVLSGPLASWLEGYAAALFAPNGVVSFGSAFGMAFGVAALCEESLKFAFLLPLALRSRRFKRYVRGVAFAAFVSMGFATIENVLYVVGYAARDGFLNGGFQVAFFRSFTSLLGHFVFSVWMGYFLAIAVMGRRRGENLFQKRGGWRNLQTKDWRHLAKYLTLALAVPLGVHGLYDFFLMYAGVGGQFSGLSLITFIGFFILSVKIGFYLIDELKAKDFDIRKAKRDEKRDEFYRIAGRR